MEASLVKVLDHMDTAARLVLRSSSLGTRCGGIHRKHSEHGSRSHKREFRLRYLITDGVDPTNWWYQSVRKGKDVQGVFVTS